MKKLIAGLLALLALSVMVATAAAEPNTVWLCLELQIACVGHIYNLEALTLYDLGASSGVECAVEAVASEGSLNGTEGEVTTVTFAKGGAAEPECKPTAKGLNTKEEEVTNACKKVTELKAINLPWNTVNVLEGGVAYALLLEEGTHGEPGYLILCEIVGGTKQNDECVANAAHTPLLPIENLLGGPTEPPLVTWLFPITLLEGKLENANCTVGGAETGLVLGELLIEALQGGVAVSLEISNEE